jgi:hypothetical protein
LVQVSIEAQVMGVKEPRHKISINGRDTWMEEVHVSDATGTIPVKVWGDQVGTIYVGGSYIITNVGTRFYDYPYLTTTLKTVFSETADVVGATGAPEVAQGVVKGIIEAAMVTVARQCSACKGEMNPSITATLLLRCPLCKMRQKASSVGISVHADVVVAGAESTKRLKMGDSIIKTFVGLDFANMEEVEDFLLLKDSWEITYQESQVISATFM